MGQTSFSVGNGGSLSAVLADIGSGADAAQGTAYTITVTAAIDLSSASVSLLPGSSVTLEGPSVFIIDAFAVSGTVTTDLDFTGTVTLQDSVLDNVALAMNVGGTVVAGQYTGAVQGTPGDAGDSAVNDGTIQYGGSFAAIKFAIGTVQNGWNGPASALVSGVAGGVLLTTSGLVQNGGTIVASGTASASVFLGAGTVDNGQIGDTGAEISGGLNGVEVTGAGLVNNDGTITGVASDAVYLGSGTVQNGESGDVTALINGGPADNGVWIGAGGGTVANFGTITGGGASGVYLQGGGVLTNGASSDTTALVSGAVQGVLLRQSGAVFNDGTILANGSNTLQKVIGAFLVDGGTIENLGASSMIGGVDWGAIVEGASGTVTNLGTIQASGTAGLGVDLTAGGTVVNGLTAGSAATITGVFDGVRISAGAPGAGVEVLNAGTIEGGVGVDFASGATASVGTLTNDGLIESTSGTNGYAVVFGTGAETLVLQSAGAFVGRVLGNNAAGSSTTLELVVGTQGTLSGLASDGGTVADTAGSFVFGAFGTVALDAGASWTVSAPGTLDTLDNVGTLIVSGGAATVTGTLTNSGTVMVDPSTLTLDGALVSNGPMRGIIDIGTGSTVTLQAGADSGQTLQFTAGGTAETLALGASSSVQAVIGNFGTGTAIDLLNTAVTGLLYSGGTLDVLNNGTMVAALDLPGSFVTSSFAYRSDAGTGTFITPAVPCFAVGTRIRTCAGEMAVEALRIGDRLPTLFGDEGREIVWIGHRRVDCRCHPDPRKVWPVRIAAHAFGPGLPCRDLLLSPDHAVLVGDVLIPVKYLINRRTIEQLPADEITYYHVELARHDVLWAEGLPAESYLDTGTRLHFANGGGPTALHPDFAGLWEAYGCAPLIATGPALAAARALVDARAATARPMRRRKARGPALSVSRRAVA